MWAIKNRSFLQVNLKGNNNILIISIDDISTISCNSKKETCIYLKSNKEEFFVVEQTIEQIISALQGEV